MKASPRHRRQRAYPTKPSRTALLEFSAVTEFDYQAANASASSRQQGRRREHYYTTSNHFIRQVIAANPRVFRVHDQAARLSCLDAAVWSRTDFRKKRILFLLPSQALGNNVCIWFFLQAFLERHSPRKLAVCCTESSTDIFLLEPAFKTSALWIGQKALGAFDYVIDLGHLESRRDIDLWPIDMEADLLEAFGLTPSARFDGRARVITAAARPNINIYPVASSPLRSLPPGTVTALATALSDTAQVSLCLNVNQQQGRLLAEAVKANLPPGITIVDSFTSIGELLASIDSADYVVVADSGPAHMSKLFATPGTAVYTSAPGDVLQGRFSNLTAWTVAYEGAHCRTPCGLAKLRQSQSGDIGCMGSLALPLEALPSTPTRPDAGLVRRLFDQPVPCVAQLDADPGALIKVVLNDLEQRLGR